MNCTYHDSPITDRGTKRKRIYISCSNGMHREAKYQALKDFTASKSNINNVEKIKPFKRTGAATPDKAGQDIIYERQEWADAAFTYMRYIL